VTNITAMLIKSVGFLCAHVPEYVLAFFAKVIGHLLVALPSRRRRILLSNLDRAFPEWPRDRLLKVARASAACLVEMGLFSLAYPFLSKDHIRRLLRIPPETERKLNELRRSSKPVVFFIPHVALFELLAASPHFRPGGERRLGAIYRPNNSPSIDNWITEARKKKGVVMFARNEAIARAKGHLRNNNWLAILFDQNAGFYGTLSLFLGRLASVSPLPSLLSIGTHARTVFLLPQRTNFFQATLRLREMKSNSVNEIIDESHSLLASHLISSDKSCSEWLWAHSRWKTQKRPHQRFSLTAKRENLPPPEKLPLKTKFWIRLPNWLGDIVMALPLIKVLREGRPDAQITLICQPHFRPLLELFNIADNFKTLPKKGTFGYYLKIFQWRHQYPDLHILFTNSLRGDLESFLIGAPQRFGLEHPKKSRKFLTHTYKPPTEILNRLNSTHQIQLWEKMFRHFGLRSEISANTFALPQTQRKTSKIGFIPGSSNNPSKCWPVDQWIDLGTSLLKKDPELEIHLYGTHEDIEKTNAIKNALPRDRVYGKAGSTDLPQLAKELATCSVAIGNDTGGMHLANALGTPVAVLCGPTNPLITGPFYDSPKVCLQPKGCPPEGGFSMNLLEVNQVITVLREKPFSILK
jgi:heptosyltransferase II